MTDTEITGGNRIIREFVSGRKMVGDYYQPGSGWGHISTLTYHKDWNDLMKAIKKIGTMYHDYIHIEEMNDIYELTLFSPIEMVFEYAVAFIKWYNKQQK